jgi:hypothetical protein
MRLIFSIPVKSASRAIIHMLFPQAGGDEKWSKKLDIRQNGGKMPHLEII